MGFDAEYVIDAFWEAADAVPDELISPAGLQLLLASVCDRLNGIEPADRLRSEAEECREMAALSTQLTSGSNVSLGYVYSAYGDGFVELTIVNAEGTELDETGTVIGTPGARVLFDKAEARRAIEILGTIFVEPEDWEE